MWFFLRNRYSWWLLEFIKPWTTPAKLCIYQMSVLGKDKELSDHLVAIVLSTLLSNSGTDPHPPFRLVRIVSWKLRSVKVLCLSCGLPLDCDAYSSSLPSSFPWSTYWFCLRQHQDPGCRLCICIHGLRFKTRHGVQVFTFVNEVREQHLFGFLLGPLKSPSSHYYRSEANLVDPWKVFLAQRPYTPGS